VRTPCRLHSRHALVHDSLIEDGDVPYRAVEIDILLVVHADQIVESVPCDCEHRLQIAISLIEAIQKMHAAWAGKSAANTDASRIFRVTHGRERPQPPRAAPG